MLARLTMIEINKNVILVSGAKNAAIYDFNANKLYAINTEALYIINRVVLKNEAPYTDVETTYISQLKQANLISDNFAPRSFEMKPDNEIKLSFAWLELTEGCNLKCRHCYEGNDHRHSPNELSTNQWKAIINDLYLNGCRKLQFTGGECLLRPDLSELIVYAADIGMTDITVFTNASLLNDSVIDTLLKNKVKVRFSLYGHCANVHDAITQRPGSFDKTIINVKKMMSLGIDVTPAVVIMKENENYIEQIKDYILSLCLNYSGYDVIREVYSGTQSSHIPVRQDVLDSKKKRSPSFQISKEKFNRALSHNTCWYGKFAITPTGKVIPCIFERNISLGDVTKQSISDILNSQSLRYHWNLDFSQVEFCKDCEYRFACKDCRPLGMAKCNDVKAKNPRCTYNPYTGTWQ